MIQVDDMVYWPRLLNVRGRRLRARLVAVDGEVGRVSYKIHGVRCIQLVPLTFLEPAPPNIGTRS